MATASTPRRSCRSHTAAAGREALSGLMRAACTSLCSWCSYTNRHSLSTVGHQSPSRSTACSLLIVSSSIATPSIAESVHRSASRTERWIGS